MLRRMRRSVAFCNSPRSSSAFAPPRPMTMPGFAVCNVRVTWFALRSMVTPETPASGSVFMISLRRRASSSTSSG